MWDLGSGELTAGAASEQDATIAGPVEAMPEGAVMDVQFIASVAVITPDPSVSRRLYVDALGLPLTGSQDDYLHSEDIDGRGRLGARASSGDPHGQLGSAQHRHHDQPP